jgi:hypothetical protein
VDVINTRLICFTRSALLLSRHSFTVSPRRAVMFARAISDYQGNSSQIRASTQLGSSQIQKPLDFSGVKRKAFDTIDDSNKRPAMEPAPLRVKEPKSTLSAALSNSESFNDTTSQLFIDGEPFDEADFEDITIDESDKHPSSTPAKQVEARTQSSLDRKASVLIDQDEEYFNDAFEMDWDTADSTKPLDGHLRSSPPVSKTTHSTVPTTQPATSVPVEQIPILIEEKENTSFPPEAVSAPTPAAPEEQPLSKVLFPSSSQPLSWSPSPPVQPKVKRSLPWVTNPNRYGTAQATGPASNWKKDTQIKSIVRKDPKRSLSTLSTEHVDWNVLGITPQGLLKNPLSNNERMEQPRPQQMQETKKADESKKSATDWIDNPIVKAEAGRRRKKEELKAQTKILPPMDKKPVVAKVFLSQEQLSVRKMVVEDKKSVFFTGSAGIRFRNVLRIGTGKSVLLREIISGLKKSYERNPESVAVTASTGLAACNVGGITLHSFAAFGLGRESVEDLAKKIRRNKKGFDRWRRTKVLIIDESISFGYRVNIVSMVDGAMFDKLEHLARILRKDHRPFGGIQLVVTGDFFQLPPVPDYGREAKFTFEAQKWKECIPHTIKLTNVFRQKDQGIQSFNPLTLEFVTMLNQMRLGTLSADSINKFKALQRPILYDDGIEPTELFPTRQEVDNANNSRLRNLPGKVYKFVAEEGGSVLDPRAREKILQNCMAPQVIELKKDAQVMLIKNMDENLVNGSLGKILGFMSESTYSLCEREAIDPEVALGFDAQASDDPFGFNTLDEEDGDSESALRKKRKLLKLRAMANETTQLWPLVRFTTAAGYHIHRLITRERWATELPDGEVQAYRRQVPLILAYAISIHKAQGQTLSRVRVDLGKVFEKGQAYVALSRATSREGLQILRFEARKVMAHPKVAGFYRSLEGIDQALQKEYEMPKKDAWIAKALESLQARDDQINEEEEEAAYAYG